MIHKFFFRFFFGAVLLCKMYCQIHCLVFYVVLAIFHPYNGGVKCQFQIKFNQTDCRKDNQRGRLLFIKQYLVMMIWFAQSDCSTIQTLTENPTWSRGTTGKSCEVPSRTGFFKCHNANNLQFDCKIFCAILHVHIHYNEFHMKA